MPEEKWGTRWVVVLDTAEDHDYLSEDDGGEEYGARDSVRVDAWSLVVLRRTGWRPHPEAKKAEN
jgi:hypothetical protein